VAEPGEMLLEPWEGRHGSNVIRSGRGGSVGAGGWIAYP